MNRPRLRDDVRPGARLSGSLGTVLSVLLGATALIVVGPVLGRGFEPGSGPSDLITVPGATRASRGAPDELIGALSGALRALADVRPAETEAVATAGRDVAQIEGEVVIPDEAASAIVLAEDAPVEPVREIVAFAPVPIAPASTAQGVAARDPPTDDDDAGELSIADATAPPAAVGESGPPPPRQAPAPTRAPLLPAGLNLSVVPTLTAPKPSPQPAPAAPTPNRQPRATPMPKPTIAPTPTRSPTAVPRSSLRIER